MKNYCKICHRKLSRKEKDLCFDCRLTKLGQLKIEPYKKKPRNSSDKVWEKINKKIK